MRFDPPLPEPVLRERGIQTVARYRRGSGQTITPVAVQHEIRIRLHPALEWDLLGYIDIETTTGLVVDVKVKARHVTTTTVERSIQPNAYLLARRQETNPAAGFENHCIRMHRRACPASADQGIALVSPRRLRAPRAEAPG